MSEALVEDRRELHYLLVGNPTAQSGKAQRWIDEALRRMATRGMRAEFMHTEPERRTIEAGTARRYTLEADRPGRRVQRPRVTQGVEHVPVRHHHLAHEHG